MSEGIHTKVFMSKAYRHQLTRRDFLRLGALAAGAFAAGCRPAPTAELGLKGPAAAVPGVLSVVQEGALARLESSASPAGVEEPLLGALIDDGWLPVERLIAPQGAEKGVFWRFWRHGTAACGLALAEGEKTTIALAEECSALAEARRGAEVESWAPEERGAWSTWEVGRFALRHPQAWGEVAQPGRA